MHTVRFSTKIKAVRRLHTHTHTHILSHTHSHTHTYTLTHTHVLACVTLSEHFVLFSFFVYILAVSVESEPPLGGAVGPREELSVCFHIEEVMKTSCEEEEEQSFLLMTRKPATSSQEEEFLSSRHQNVHKMS